MSDGRDRTRWTLTTRRWVLGGVTAVAATLAGCSRVSASLDMRSVDDRGLVEQYVHHPDRFNDYDARIFRESIRNGSTTRTVEGQPPNYSRPVAMNGSYYRVDPTVVDSEPATEYALQVSEDPSEAADDPIPYDELPEVDRRAISPLIHLIRNGDDTEEDTLVTYSRSEEAASRLVSDSEPDVVRHAGRLFEVTVESARETAIRTVRYSSDLIAEDATTLANRLKSEYLFSLSGLPSKERDIVDQAIDGGYSSTDPPDAFHSLARRLLSHRGIEKWETGGTFLVRFRDAMYWTRLSDPFLSETGDA